MPWTDPYSPATESPFGQVDYPSPRYTSGKKCSIPSVMDEKAVELHPILIRLFSDDLLDAGVIVSEADKLGFVEDLDVRV